MWIKFEKHLFAANKVCFNALKGSLQRETRGFSKMTVVSYEYGTQAIGVCLFLNFAVVFSSTYFRFRPSTSLQIIKHFLCQQAMRTE
jgi:hypothetical protein